MQNTHIPGLTNQTGPYPSLMAVTLVMHTLVLGGTGLVTHLERKCYQPAQTTMAGALAVEPVMEAG